jgi:hypothetical protein
VKLALSFARVGGLLRWHLGLYWRGDVVRSCRQHNGTVFWDGRAASSRVDADGSGRLKSQNAVFLSLVVPIEMSQDTQGRSLGPDQVAP